MAFGLFMPAAGFAQTPPTEDGAQSPDDRVEAYLLDRGMLELLARQLEARVQQETVTRDRLAIAERLAGVYSRVLSGATSVEEQRRWESAGERLLARVPEANTIELRLSLARASYTRVERVAEQHALRMIDEEQRTFASVRLADLRGRFVSIGQDADRRVRELEREEERNPRVESEWLRETLEQARRQRSMAFYLAGWSSYYMAELSTDRAEAASAALRHFGWLLGAERNQEATLDGFSIPALQYEHIGRAALAVAGCYSMVGRDAVSEQWLDAIEGFDGLPEPVREQIFVRRITHAAQSSSWARATEIVAKKRDSAIPIAGEFTSDPGKPLPVNHARLLAVLTFETIAREKEHSDPRVERLRDLALGDLVVQDQLGHVLDLAQHYGTDTFGDSTFVSLQVRGLGLYQSARDRQAAAGESSDEPTRDARASELYLRAAELFEHALKARDVERFAVASANTNMLLGLSMFYAGEATLDGEALMLLAADALERAAARFASRERAADALWMAIRSLDQKIADEPELRESQIGVRRDGMVERFLRDYPEDEKAAALILRLAESENIGLEQRIELLMAVPQSNPLQETAKRAASRLAYDRYRSASDLQRDFLAARFSEIAEPLLVIDVRRGTSGDVSAQRAAVARARQIADAGLSMRVPDLDRVSRAVSLLERMLADGFEGAETVRGEIRFRRAQLALAAGRHDEAERIIASLREDEDTFGDSSVRLFYRDAVLEYDRLRKGSDAEAAADAARRLLRVGTDLIAQLERGQQALDSASGGSALVSVRIRVGAAAQALWTLQKDRAALEAGLNQFRAVLREEPQNRDALRGVAELADAYGDDEDSLNAWRILLSGYPASSPEWYEARTAHLVVLARIDRPRAAAVLRQHLVLHPEVGPEPYRSRLLELAKELDVAVPESQGGSR